MTIPAEFSSSTPITNPSVSKFGLWRAQNRRTYRILADGTLEIDECIAFWPMELPKLMNVPDFATTAWLIHGTLWTRTIQNNTFLNGRPPRAQTNGRERKRTETNANVRAQSAPPQPRDWLKLSLQTLHPQGMSGNYRKFPRQPAQSKQLESTSPYAGREGCEALCIAN